MSIKVVKGSGDSDIVGLVSRRDYASYQDLKMKYRVYFFLAALAGWPVFGLPPEQVEFFESKIRPVLAENCYECHNSVNESEAGLALDYHDALLAGKRRGRGDPAGKSGRERVDLGHPPSGRIRNARQWSKTGRRGNWGL